MQIYTNQKQIIEYNIAHNNFLQNLCLPLTKLGVTTFSYVRFYNNKVFRLTNNLKWNEYSVVNNVVNNNETEKTLEATLVQQRFIGISRHLDEVNLATLHQHDLYDIIAIYEKKQDYVELHCYATDKKNLDISALCLSNIQMLFDFVEYFKIKASHILDDAAAKGIFIPSQFTIEDKKSYTCILNNHKISINNDLISEFKKIVSERKSYLLCNSQKVFLSYREMQCLALSARGKTAKEIALILNISPRTVESYMNQIKGKVGYKYKSQLIDLYYLNNLKNCQIDK